MAKCLECENTSFRAHQRCYHDVTVDENNNFLDNIEIYMTEKPYGPYTCTKCGRIYDELPKEFPE
jgi:hypothetical protein